MKSHYGAQWRNNEDLQCHKFVLPDGEEGIQESKKGENEILCENIDNLDLAFIPLK